MSIVTISSPSPDRDLLPSGSGSITSPLPSLLHTPLGLALMEIQGNINHPGDGTYGIADAITSAPSISVGRLVFPDYHDEPDEGAWMKRVWLYVGEHQRMTGEVKRLPKPLGVLRRKARGIDAMDGAFDDDVDENEVERLEIAEIIRWKIIFASRPEPVGVSSIGDTA